MTKPPLTRDLAEVMESLHQTLEARKEAATPDTPQNAPKPPAQIVQFPLWPEPVRACPNSFLRSALFAAIHSKKRKLLQGERPSPDMEPNGVVITGQSGYVIEYCGTQLNQYDLDVWLQAIHLARRQPLETECSFRGNAFLKTIGRMNSKREYEDLNNSLNRLRKGTLVIKWAVGRRRYVFIGGLISSYTREETTRVYKVTFAKEILTLFAPACWTLLQWEERLALKGKPLALWLHSYFCSHASPHPVSIAFIHEKCGSPTTLLKHFKTELKRALSALEERTTIKPALSGDLVTVRRTLSVAQARHRSQNVAARKRERKPKRGRAD